MKLLLISIEFIDPIFSGNGVACRSLVRSILKNTDHTIFVICGCPQVGTDKSSRSLNLRDFTNSLAMCEEECKRLDGVAIHLPNWYRTDIYSSYSEFSEVACSIAAITEYNADFCLSIDWTGSLVFRSLQTAGCMKIPSVYFVYCCYSFLPNISSSDKEFYRLQEFLSMEASSLTISICGGDQKKLRSMGSSKEVKVLLPPLRIDVQRILHQNILQPAIRRFVTCSLRLHPSKNVEVFVDAIGLLKTLLLQKGLVPVLCGASADPRYAAACRSKLKSIFPESIIYEQFLDAGDMVELFRATKLNVHTALYEAYGMTIVEAAAAGKKRNNARG